MYVPVEIVQSIIYYVYNRSFSSAMFEHTTEFILIAVLWSSSYGSHTSILEHLDEDF